MPTTSARSLPEPDREEPAEAEPIASEGRRSPYSSGYMGQCTRVVSEVAVESRLRGTLSEVAREVDRVVIETVEDVAQRGDKREYLAAEHAANERVYRAWRGFLRELADFERRFR